MVPNVVGKPNRKPSASASSRGLIIGTSSLFGGAPFFTRTSSDSVSAISSISSCTIWGATFHLLQLKHATAKCVSNGDKDQSMVNKLNPNLVGKPNKKPSASGSSLGVIIGTSLFGGAPNLARTSSGNVSGTCLSAERKFLISSELYEGCIAWLNHFKEITMNS
ncbi:hypothetical protein GmHk_13G038606 [Glycine max]|nr:hypothetical protein GmHk_13G038606 [Glycine max]